MNLFCLLLKIKLLRVKPSSFYLLLLLFSSTFVFSQQTETVDFISVKAVVRPLLKEKRLLQMPLIHLKY